MAEAPVVVKKRVAAVYKEFLVHVRDVALPKFIEEAEAVSCSEHREFLAGLRSQASATIKELRRTLG